MSDLKDFDIQLATGEADFLIAKELFIEYSKSLSINLCFQNFEKELAEIDVQYNEPFGGGLLILIDKIQNKAIGCVGVRKYDDGVGELKRMYIQNVYQGKGLGRQLLKAILGLSRDLNYKKLRLDTLVTMKSAIALYESMGFYEIDAYRFNPESQTKYFEIEL